MLLCTILKVEVDGDDEHPRPNFSIVYTANSAGKEAVGVKHKDVKAAKGSFLLYKYKETYTFSKAIVDKAVCVQSLLQPKW